MFMIESPNSHVFSPWRRNLIPVAIAISVSSLLTASPALANNSPESPQPLGKDIIVYGQPLNSVFAGMLAEDELNEANIAAYGASTVGELLEILNEELAGPDGGPTVLINGRLVTGINEISDLPTEAIAKVQLLSRELGGRLGQSATSRVINVSLKSDHRQVVLKTDAGLATAGGGANYEGEANLLRVNDGNRVSLVLRARAVDPLFESQRNIRADVLTTPFDLIGNVIASQLTGGQIDPGLTRLAGSPLSVVGLPTGIARPSLLQFAAGIVNSTDLTTSRTLISEQRAYSANGNMSHRFGDTFVSLNGRAEWIRAEGQGGLFGTTTRLPVSSPFTPFSNDVGIARYIGSPLRQNNDSFNIDVATTLNAPIGRWQLNAFAGFQHRVAHNTNDVEYDIADYQSGVQAGTINPFVSLTPEQLLLRRNVGRYKGDSSQVRAVFSGAVARLPAGEVRATATLGLRSDRASSASDLLGNTQVSSFRRNEAAVQLALQIPVVANADSKLGDITLDLTGDARATSRIGTLTDYGAAMSWVPSSALQLRGSVRREEVAPLAQTLNDPVTASENFRIFDFLTNQTVLVRYLTGGNPDLRVASRQTINAGVTWRPVSGRNLTFGADYTERRGKNIQAGLPPTSLAVQAAFPDRFVRDASGRLVVVDSRPVEFASENIQQLHWRIDFRGTVIRSNDKSDATVDMTERSFSAGRGVRANLGVDHFWVLSNKRQARPGLAVVDLLAGGASGYGGGIPRHIVRLAAGASTRGLGLQLSGSWRSSTRIRVASAPSAGDLRFSSRMTADVRFFADLGTLLPTFPVAKAARFSIEAKNLFDSKQRVSDATGANPLRYQPYLLDSLGRTVTFSLRKSF